MTACVRIYTLMGKENCLTVDSFSLTTEENSTCFIDFQDRTEARVTEIERVVESGQPCNMHIRYKDNQVEAVCTLNGCKLVNARILCDKPDMQLIGSVNDAMDNWDNEGGMII